LAIFQRAGVPSTRNHISSDRHSGVDVRRSRVQGSDSAKYTPSADYTQFPFGRGCRAPPHEQGTAVQLPPQPVTRKGQQCNCCPTNTFSAEVAAKSRNCARASGASRAAGARKYSPAARNRTRSPAAPARQLGGARRPSRQSGKQRAALAGNWSYKSVPDRARCGERRP